MNRLLVGAALSCSLALAVGACDGGGNYGNGYPGGSQASCAQYTACGACTPVQGCGWCFNRTSGMCAADPDTCAGSSEFTWTWDPPGCPGFDASVLPVDGGATAIEASTIQPEAAAEASVEAAVEASSPADSGGGTDALSEASAARD